MNKIRPFQIVLIAGFGLLAIIAVVVLTTYQAKKSEEEKKYGESIIIWGELPRDAFNELMQDISREDKAFQVVEYRQISKDTFDDEFVNAIAEGNSPDLIVLPSKSLVTHRSKLVAVPYTTLPERTFRDSYVDGAEMYSFQEGIYGIPFVVDPMVMYWNRDLFASNGIAQPPTSWDTVVTDIVPKLTTHDTSRNVLQSGLAFGEFRNVAHAKNMLLVLALQSGSKLTTVEGNQYKVNLNQSHEGGNNAPLESAVQFYTEFSNVQSPRYSWNRAMETDTNAFLAGDLGIYFGLGSEYRDLSDKNPNLNFDVAPVPQGTNATALRTYGEFYAFAIPKASSNINASYSVAQILARAESAKVLAQNLRMAPVRRDLIQSGDSDFFRKIILDSALIARGWYDPQSKDSDGVFMQMVEDIVSNRSRITDSISDAIGRLTLLY